jgi:hypothetical protein
MKLTKTIKDELAGLKKYATKRFADDDHFELVKVDYLENLDEPGDFYFVMVLRNKYYPRKNDHGRPFSVSGKTAFEAIENLAGELEFNK